MAESDNRRKKRVSVEGVTGSVMFSHDIKVLNVSIDGVAFRTTKRLQINKIYLLKIPCGKERLPLRGEVVWCTLSGSMKTPEGGVAPLYTLGMRFVPGQADRIEALKTFIERQEKEERLCKGTRVGITLAPGSPNEFSLPHDYPVSHLSTEDLLVVVDTKLDPDQRVQLEIRLPHDLSVFPVGRIRSAEGIDNDHYRTMVEFTQITERDETRIRQALEATPEV